MYPVFIIHTNLLPQANVIQAPREPAITPAPRAAPRDWIDDLTSGAAAFGDDASSWAAGVSSAFDDTPGLYSSLSSKYGALESSIAAQLSTLTPGAAYSSLLSEAGALQSSLSSEVTAAVASATATATGTSTGTAGSSAASSTVTAGGAPAQTAAVGIGALMGGMAVLMANI